MKIVLKIKDKSKKLSNEVTKSRNVNVIIIVKRVMKRHENKLNLEKISNNFLYEKNISFNTPDDYNSNLYQ